MTDFIHVPSDGGEPSMTDEPAVVHIKRMWTHGRYGLKLGIDLPAPWDDDANVTETFKQLLSWDTTHREWNPAGKEWTADGEKLNTVVRKMNEAGFDVTVHVDAAREFEKDGYVFLPDHR